jgi:hypothetical protein
MANLPAGEMERFRGEILSLFRHLSDRKLLEATVTIMDKAKAVMDARPELYDEHERAGFALGQQVLARGFGLFQTFTQEEIPQLLLGIEVVEIDWYDRIKATAAALGNRA